MSKKKSKAEIITHSKNALSNLENLLTSYTNSENEKIVSKADKLSYWLEDYAKFLEYEPTFDSKKLKKYKRGEVVKVHLGYNIGSEEGGLHYCVVLDKNNSIHNSVVTVIPLTSIKPHTDLKKLHLGEVYLGNSIYTTIFAKSNSLQKYIVAEIEKLQKRSDELKILLEKSKEEKIPSSILSSELISLSKEIVALSNQHKLLLKIQKETHKMKQGSIALVSQITTVSKIRIYDPKTSHDVLADIRLSNENLDAIDDELKKLYLK